MKSQKNGISRMTLFSCLVAADVCRPFYYHANSRIVSKPHSTFVRLNHIQLGICAGSSQTSGDILSDINPFVKTYSPLRFLTYNEGASLTDSTLDQHHAALLSKPIGERERRNAKAVLSE